MSSEIMQETTPLVECSAFHRGMSVLEASLRNTEDSDAIISCLLKGAAEFYGASRASVVEADWDLGIGVITYEWCKDGVSAQRDMLQCLPMEKFPRWRKALRANKPVVISDLQRLEKVYPDEAAFFREYGVTTLLAAPFSKRINQGFIAVDDPTRYTDDPVFLFIASYAVVVELNEIKQQQSLLAATKASKYNPEDIHVNFFGGMEIISSKGTLTGEDIKADQCYLLLAYLILNHKKNFTVDTLAEIICPYDELDSPYKVVNNIVYRLRRTLSVIGLDKLVIGKNGTFQINPNFNIHTDFDRFEDACIQLKTEENPDMRHSLYHSAVDMYKGQLLPRCEHELWLMQLSMYYQSLYLQITKGYVCLKMECKDYILAQKTAIDSLSLWTRNQELWTTSTYFLYGGALQDDYRPGKEYIEPSTEALVSIMIPDIFPQDLLHVPPTDILRFREKRKDERNQFLNAIKTLRNELAQADAPEVIEAIINDEKKKIDSAANEYRKSMDILRVAKFGGILTTVITVAADVLGYCSNFPDLYKGAIESSGLWAGILTGIFEKRVGNINNPYTYLAQIKSTFSYYPGASKLFGGQPQIAKYNYTLYRGFEEFIND